MSPVQVDQAAAAQVIAPLEAPILVMVQLAQLIEAAEAAAVLTVLAVQVILAVVMVDQVLSLFATQTLLLT